MARRISTSVSFDPSLLAALSKFCTTTGVNRSSFITNAVLEKLRRYEGDPGSVGELIAEAEAAAMLRRLDLYHKIHKAFLAHVAYLPSTHRKMKDTLMAYPIPMGEEKVLEDMIYMRRKLGKALLHEQGKVLMDAEKERIIKDVQERIIDSSLRESREHESGPCDGEGDEPPGKHRIMVDHHSPRRVVSRTTYGDSTILVSAPRRKKRPKKGEPDDGDD